MEGLKPNGVDRILAEGNVTMGQDQNHAKIHGNLAHPVELLSSGLGGDRASSCSKKDGKKPCQGY